ncbi:MAG: hypothetical protein IT381_05115 [Deltaproteobacteria bacterium]|nr:hypothetical protein [Deltaproteobacteria bacterium]
MRSAALLLLVCTAACPAGNTTTTAQQNNQNNNNNNMTTTVTTLSYNIQAVPGCGTKTGTQTAIATKGGEVVFATISQLPTTTSCTAMFSAPADVPNYDICYGETSGGAVTTTSLAQVSSVSLMGVGIAVAPNGNVSVAYTGGPQAPARCGGTDVLVRTKSGAMFAAPTTIASDSAGTPEPSEAADCAIENVCGSGAATGFWPALAYDAMNRLSTVFRDMHFGFAGDDFEKSDVELVRAGGGVRTVDGGKGGGEYNRVAATADNALTIIHNNSQGVTAHRGIWALRESGGTFVRNLVSTDVAGEMMGFAINASGLHGLAYYDTQKQRLSYVESTDGQVWSDVDPVDTNGNIGMYPSLAFDPNGEPTIAYYRCNKYIPGSSNCDQNEDGLYLARRANGSWVKNKLVGESASFDGLYPAITFAGGKAVIAYQKNTYDPSANVTTSELFLAKEP